MTWRATIRVFWALFAGFLAVMAGLGMVLAPVVLLIWEVVR